MILSQENLNLRQERKSLPNSAEMDVDGKEKRERSFSWSRQQQQSSSSRGTRQGISPSRSERLAKLPKSAPIQNMAEPVSNGAYCTHKLRATHHRLLFAVLSSITRGHNQHMIARLCDAGGGGRIKDGLFGM